MPKPIKICALFTARIDFASITKDEKIEAYFSAVWRLTASDDFCGTVELSTWSSGPAWKAYLTVQCDTREHLERWLVCAQDLAQNMRVRLKRYG